MRVAFISTMAGYPWGGSEELWSQAAARLAEQGVAVSASVHGWAPPHARVLDLERRGIELHLRQAHASAWRRAAHRLAGRPEPLHVADYRRFLRRCGPALVIVSDGGPFVPVELAELCVELGLPFVTIAQANHDDWWPDDGSAGRYRAVLSAAARCYFVSAANLRLAEKQIGGRLTNAEVVRNPFNVRYGASPAWPPLDDAGLRMACVARLHPPSKGQDLLFEALAQPPWSTRAWRLALYGAGPNAAGLERLAERLGLASRVEFRGFADDVAAIWASNHLLVLPSRYEGLPLALVEAMLCNRAAVVSDIGGNAEVVADGATGFVAESATAPALARALERAWEQRGDLLRIGQSAGRRIRELVPPDPVGDLLKKLAALSPMTSRA